MRSLFSKPVGGDSTMDLTLDMESGRCKSVPFRRVHNFVVCYCTPIIAGVWCLQIQNGQPSTWLQKVDLSWNVTEKRVYWRHIVPGECIRLVPGCSAEKRCRGSRTWVLVFGLVLAPGGTVSTNKEKGSKLVMTVRYFSLQDIYCSMSDMIKTSCFDHYHAIAEQHQQGLRILIMRTSLNRWIIENKPAVDDASATRYMFILKIVLDLARFEQERSKKFSEHGEPSFDFSWYYITGAWHDQVEIVIREMSVIGTDQWACNYCPVKP